MQPTEAELEAIKHPRPRVKTGTGFAFTAADEKRGWSCIVIANDERAARDIYDKLSKGQQAFEPSRASAVTYRIEGV